MRNIKDTYKQLAFMLLACLAAVPGHGQVRGDQYESGTVEIVSGKLIGTIRAVEAKSHDSETSIYMACNNNEGDGWKSSGSGDQWIIFDLNGLDNYQNAKGLEIYSGTKEDRSGNSIIIETSSRNNGGWSRIGYIQDSSDKQRNRVQFTGSPKRYIRVYFEADKQVQINEIYLYSTFDEVEIGSIAIQHKKAKWYSLALEVEGGSDSFDEKEDSIKGFIKAVENGEQVNLQNTHTLIDTIFVHKGRSINLTLPDWLQTTANNRTYQRWYNYLTGETFATGQSGNNVVVDLLTPAQTVSDMPTNGKGYRFKNGYVGSPMGESTPLYSMDFYYPIDNEFSGYAPNMSTGATKNNWYIIACDVSGYNDFTQNFDRETSHNSEFLPEAWEPTLSHRFIYYVHAVEDENYWYAKTIKAGKPVDVKDITMPAIRIPNHTEEMVALSMDASSYVLPSGYTESNSLRVEIPDNTNYAGIEPRTTSLSGTDRVIHFSYPADFEGNTKIVNNTANGNPTSVINVYNGNTLVAQFNLTFVKEDVLLSQSQVKELLDNEFTDNNNYYWKTLAYRIPSKIQENHGRPLTELNFDYLNINSALNYYQQQQCYPFPLEWSSSTYGFYDGSVRNNDFVGNSSYPEWGYYAILDSQNGYLESDGPLEEETGQLWGWNNTERQIPNPIDGKERYNSNGIPSRYHLYADVSDRPGTMARLPFDRKLCRGTELFVTAWVKSARGDTGKDNAGVLFTVMGVRNETEGVSGQSVVKYVPIYRFQTGQIPTTYMNDGGVDMPGFNQNATPTDYSGATNEWMQVYFSFINENDGNDDFDSYVLQIDNNSASTNGGDIYIDDIRVYLATVNPAVTQLDANCVDEPVRVNVDFNWERLLSRTGEEETTTETNNEGKIIFTILDKEKFDQLSAAGDEQAAVKQSAVNIGATLSEATEDEDPTINGSKKYMILNYNLNYNQNDDYVSGGDEALAVEYGGKLYFRKKTVTNSDLRALSADLFSDVEANKYYYIFVANTNNTDVTDDNWSELFNNLSDVCTIKYEFPVVPRNVLRLNGKVIDPSTDYCEGQTFNFTAEVRIPSGEQDPETGQQLYEPLGEDVYFDWFFGTEDEFLQTDTEFGCSLNEALEQFREAYPDAETAHDEGVVAAGNLTEQMLEMLVYYSEEKVGAADGQHAHPLVLRHQSLNITLLEGGLNVVAKPIRLEITDIPGHEDEDIKGLVCWDYIPLTLGVNSSAPTVKPGFQDVRYPEDINLDPCLRIGLKQIESVKTSSEHSLTIDLRDAKYSGVAATVDGLGLIEGTDSLYLVWTDDPNYDKFFKNGENFDELSMPVGKITRFRAEELEQGSEDNFMTVKFELDKTLRVNVDGKEEDFKFIPREGYTYNMAVHFEEKTNEDGGEGTTTACKGHFVLPIKVVPEYVKWAGDGSSNWNNDSNWKRLRSDEIRKASYAADGYFTDGTNAGEEGFVPMTFTKVLMPAGSQAYLYKAGYTEGGDWTSTERPKEITQEATENIQYDLMAYGNENLYGAEPDAPMKDLTTERYRVNMCDQIHFEPGAEMRRAEYLHYNRVWTDVEVPSGRWTLVSTPLQDVVAGDWYTQQGGSQNTEYFKDITFSETDYSRLDPYVLQRSWGGSATIVTDKDGSRPASFETMWSGVYNDTYAKYGYGTGFSIRTKEVGNGGDALFRFPKSDTSYDYGAGTLSRGNNGKLASSKMVRRDPDINKAEENLYFKATLTEVVKDADGNNSYAIVGNPFMSHLDIKKFLSVNNNVLAQKYWKIGQGDGYPVIGSADADGNWIETSTEDACLAAPFEAFYVQMAEGSTGNTVTVTFTADMEALKPDTGEGGSTTQGLVIEAASKAGVYSTAALAYNGNADNGFAGDEDAQLLKNLSGNADGLSVYTVAGDMAASVNRVKDLQQIPLGLFAADGDVTTLTFTGTDALLEPSLYDAELNTDTPITEGMTLSVSGASHGRYFIRARGAGEGTSGISEVTGDADGDVTVYSVAERQVVVSSSAGLRAVRVYAVGGQLLKSESVADGRTAVTLDGVDSGVAVVRVVTADGQTTRKLVVK